MLKRFAIDRSTFDRFAIDEQRQAGIRRFLRRAAIIVLPAIALSIFAGLLVWTIRRQLNLLTEGLAVEDEEPLLETAETTR